MSWDYDFHDGTFYRRYLQVHFRYFTAVQQLMKRGNIHGLHCRREGGNILSNTAVAQLYYEERRISVFGLVSVQDLDNLPAFYSVIALGETTWVNPLRGYGLNWRRGLEGTLAFQVAVLRSVDLWETEWHRVLDQVGNCLRVQLDDTLSDEKIREWMFDDDDFRRSKQYLTILQTLRIFGEYIGALSDELHELDELFLKEPDFPMRQMSPDELQVLRSNWDLVKETQKRAEGRLMNRISNKTEEVKSLRDGLFNASSLQEAKESSEIAKQSAQMANESAQMAKRSSIMSRYVLIFTVVTVLYLPPSFISTVFALNIFQKDPPQTKWEYKVALVSVSLVTYAVALAAVIAVKWGDELKRWIIGNHGIAS
ncbi:hypothetical protein F4678DRAFT_464363 [Xylaria arbuscula]|nr:hypothetical protein F4678DRAFT_464363 [Xylaria arbuscula]